MKTENAQLHFSKAELSLSNGTMDEGRFGSKESMSVYEYSIRGLDIYGR